jgi:hypothetical protein
MTKEHTFNCLRRCPFSQLEDEWQRLLHKQISVDEMAVTFIKFYLKNGWTKEDYEQEIQVRYYSSEEFPEVEHDD